MRKYGQVVLAGLAALLLAGCSDSIERFANTYGSTADQDPVYTASIQKPKKPVYVAPAYKPPRPVEDTIAESPIKQAPLAAPKPKFDYSSAYAKPVKPQVPVASYQPPKYDPPAAPVYHAPKLALPPVADTPEAPVYKAPKYAPPAVADAPAAPAYHAPKYTPPAVADAAPVKPIKPSLPEPKAAGASVVVADGMTLYSIAKANHLTVQQLADANGLKAPYTVSPGRKLIIPGSATAQLPAQSEPAKVADAAPVAKPVAAVSGTHVVTSGETLFSIGRQYGVSPFAIADANGIKQDKPLTLGAKLKIPAAGQVAAKPEPAVPEVTAQPAKQQAKLKLPEEIPPVEKPAQTAQVADAAPAVAPAAPAAAEPAATALALRWPLKGKVISAFGPKPNGMKNEGINIAAPEGTKILAAEAGVVAYAGNELKGYGNLILIRHSGGYVTAYAHASQLMVKKGDTVKRGDVIAASGQTGAVQSPQLHFEVRKGATALDPTKFLNAATAMN